METKIDKELSSPSGIKDSNYQSVIEVAPFVTKIGVPIQVNYLIFKRCLDIIFSLFLFVIGLPISLVACLAIMLESPGNPFYLQERVGFMGANFKMIKLRTMKLNAEAKSGAQWAKIHDNRITKVGRFLRRTRIDELPQLINILKGEMSLIGPRPERPAFTEEFSQKYPGFEQRLRIKPGLSGLAQVHGGYDITPDQKLHIDLIYCETVSFKTDFLIFFATIKTIFTGEGAR